MEQGGINLPSLKVPVFLDIAPIGKQDAQVRAASAAVAEAAAQAFRERFNAATAEAGKGLAAGIERSTEPARAAGSKIGETAAKEVGKRLDERTGRGAAESVARGIGDGSRDAQRAGRKVGESGAEGISEGLGKGAGEQAAADLAAGLADGSRAVEDAGREVGSAGSAGIGDGLGKGAGRRAAEDLAAGMKEGEGAVRDAASRVAVGAESALSTGVGGEAGERAAGEFAAGMERQLERVEGAAGRVATTSAKTLDSGIGSAAGEKAATEFADGIAKGAPAARRRAAGFSDAVVAKFRETFGVKEGEDAARRVADGIERQFRLAQADITESLARGLISQREADRLGREAGAAYKAALLAEIEKRGAAGTLSDDDFLELTDKLAKVGDKAGTEFSQGLIGKIRQLPGVVQGVIATGVAAVIVRGMQRAIDSVAALGRAVGETARLARGFAVLTRSQGLVPDEVLRNLQRATLGTVRSNDLIRQSNMLLNSELKLSSEQIGELAYLSRRLAESIGSDAATGFQRMSEGIVRMRTTTLSQMGVIVRVEDATRRWAAANGKNAQSLTDAERQLAIYNAVVDEARKKVAALGDEQVDTGTRIDQVAVYWEELKSAIMLAVAETPQVSAFFEAIGVGAEDASEKIQELADKIAAFVTAHGYKTFGAASGAATGALVGSIVPGVGTALGGAVGGGVGLLVGSGQDILTGAPTTSEAYDQIQADRARANQLEELRTGKELNDLIAERGRLHLEIMGLQQQGLGSTLRAKEAQEELAAVEDGIRRARAEADRDNEPTSRTPEEVRAIESARKALQEQVRAYQALEPLREMTGDLWEVPDTTEARLQRIYQIESELLEITRQRAAAQGDEPAGLQELIDARERELEAIQASVQATREQWENLPQVKAQLAEVVRLAEVIGKAVDMGDDRGFQTITSGVNGMTRALKEAADAETELQRARLAQDPARIAAALKRQEAAQRAVADDAARAMGIFEAAAESGAIDQAALNALIAEMIALLEQAGISAEDFAKSGNDWQALTQSIERVARGVLSIADALGIVDDRTRRTLQGLVDTASGIGGLITSGGTDIGSWAQTIGGGIGIIKGIFGSDPEDIARLERHRNAMRALEVALLDLRDAYLQNVSSTQFEADREFAERFAGAAGGYRIGPDGERRVVRDPRSREDLAARLDMDVAEVERWLRGLDERYNLGLMQLWESGEFRALFTAVQRIPEAIDEQTGKLGQFPDTVQGTIDRVEWESRVTGRTDQVEHARAINEALKEGGFDLGALGPYLDRIAELDLSTEEGQRERREIIDQILVEMDAGGFNLGDLTAAQAREWVETWALATPTVEPEDPEPVDTTVADTLARIRFELDALGVTDPVERIRATIQALRDAGVSFGEFADELAELDTLDLTTVEGQTRQGEIIAEMVARMSADGADLGGLDPQALRQIILEYARAAGEVAPEETVARGVDRSVTETTMRREVSLLTTIAYWQEQAARYLAAMSGDSTALPVAQVTYSPVEMPPPLTVADLTAGFEAALHAFQFPPVYVEVIQPPSPAALGLTPPAAPNIHNEINLGAIHLDVQTVEAMDEAAMQRLARTITDRQVEEMDHALAGRIRDMERALGHASAGRRL